MTSKAEMLKELKTMLRDVFAARAAGSSGIHLARRHGYIDGYMRGLLECGGFENAELLAIVAEQRAVVCGPATNAAAEQGHAPTSHERVAGPSVGLPAEPTSHSEVAA